MLGGAADSRPWIVALGGNELNAGLGSVARRRGARILVVDWNDARPRFGEHHLRLDIKDTDAVLAAIAPRIPATKLLFAYTSSDVATETVAQIHTKHGLLRPPEPALNIARHKPSMNEAWQRHRLSDKRFRQCRTLSELLEFHRRDAGRRANPTSILKPAAGSSSRGVTILHRDDSEDVLTRALKRATSIDPYGEVIVEEYVNGTEFTAELLGDSAGNVRVLGLSKKYHSANAGRGRVATKLHYNAPDVSQTLHSRIADFARSCFRALGLHTSLGHFELIVRPDGRLVPIELGARSTGFVATHLVDAAAEREGMLLDEYERILRGARVANDAATPRRSAMYFFYDFPAGVGRREGTSLMRFAPPGIRSLASDRSNLVPGRSFTQLDSDFDRPGFEILVGDRDRLTIGAVERAESAHRQEFLRTTA